MQLLLRNPNLPLTEREQKYLEKKVEHLQKLAAKVSDESTQIHLDVFQTDIKTTDHKLQVNGTLHLPHGHLRVESNGLTFQEAVDIFVDKMKRQIEKYKTKYLWQKGISA